MVAVAMRMRWWNQRRQPVDEFQGGEYQLGAAIRLRFGQVVYQPLRVDGLEPLQGERRAGTIAQQPLEPGPVSPRPAPPAKLLCSLFYAI